MRRSKYSGMSTGRLVFKICILLMFLATYIYSLVRSFGAGISIEGIWWLGWAILSHQFLNQESSDN